MSQLVIVAVAVDRLHAMIAPMSFYLKDHRNYAINCGWALLCCALIPTLLMYAGVDLSSTPMRCNVAASTSRAIILYFVIFAISIAMMIIVSYALVL